MNWLHQNIGNIIVLTTVLLLLSSALIKIRKTGSKNGCTASTGDCTQCPYNTACRKQR